MLQLLCLTLFLVLREININGDPGGRVSNSCFTDQAKTKAGLHYCNHRVDFTTGSLWLLGFPPIHKLGPHSIWPLAISFISYTQSASCCKEADACHWTRQLSASKLQLFWKLTHWAKPRHSIYRKHFLFLFFSRALNFRLLQNSSSRRVFVLFCFVF